MSDLSVNAHEIQYARRCRCGLIALYLTAWSDANTGRRFYKCPRSKVSCCGFFEWIDEELPRRAMMMMQDLKTKLDAAKVERNNLRNKVYDMEQATIVQRGPMKMKVEELEDAIKAERDNSKNLFDEMKDVITVERHNLKMKLDEMEKFQLVEAEKASNLEVKVKKMRTIILISWALLFALVVVGMMK
ncbi:uncharacterized protein LOC107790162 [Nicotiana tabacum]|uniref:Uncharacterized protein LOC107790162 n=2 Tax=Nicotiana TaxID=4085 RepID=A0A1S3ZT11_TOBAC|nr:PREDICTED: uncharacterized protein LOC104215556 [Nicotiana sylvestris]XP_016467551.1 PREDICTED: uncharacterized protein LOC107790162 [Nicotiana tabacum]